MFWKKKQVKPAEPEASAPPTDLAGAALDAVATLLRVFGQHAFDLDEVKSGDVSDQCEEWARHVLVGSASTADADEGQAVCVRDWRGMRHFYADHRRLESEYVGRTLGDFRDLIWAFIHELSRAVAEDQKGDGSVRKQLRRLEQAVTSSSTEDLKREASSAVNLISHIIEERQQRHERQLEEFGARLETMRGELADARKRMTLDPLTRLYNRAAFDEQVERLTDLAAFFVKPVFLFMIDVDHFKWVNDTFGHPAGDEVLRQLGGCILDGFKRQDDFAARYGGDEFAILIQDVTPEIVEHLAERLTDSIRDLEIPQGDELLRITASVGIARYYPGEEATSWVERADRALYEAKQRGRDRIVFAKAPD